MDDKRTADEKKNVQFDQSTGQGEAVVGHLSRDFRRSLTEVVNITVQRFRYSIEFFLWEFDRDNR